MKEIRRDPSWHLSPVRLRWEDLKRLHAFLMDQELEVGYEYGDKEYESPEELRDDVPRESLPELKISIRSADDHKWAHMSVTIGRTETYVHGDANLVAAGAFTVETLRQSVPWHLWTPRGAWWHGLLGVTAVAGGWLVPAFLGTILVDPWRVPGMVVGVALYLMIIFRPKSWSGPRVFLRGANETAGFWKRNADQVWIAVITAVVTGAFGFALGALTN